MMEMAASMGKVRWPQYSFIFSVPQKILSGFAEFRVKMEFSGIIRFVFFGSPFPVYYPRKINKCKEL